MTEISTSLDTLQTQGDKNRKRWGMGGGNQDGATHCVSCSALCWEAEECAGGGVFVHSPPARPPCTLPTSEVCIGRGTITLGCQALFSKDVSCLSGMCTY